MQRPDGLQKLARTAFLITSVLLVVAGAAWGIRLLTSPHGQVQASSKSANNGTSGYTLAGELAPDFTLTDQFGHSVTLSTLRGHEVVLSFIDSRCTEICPLTAQILYAARARLSASQASHVELVAVNANPGATSRAAVLSWSIAHGMLHQWSFLTGPAQQLKSIYRLYHVYDQVASNGSVSHDPVVYIIDARGHEQLLFETLNSKKKSDLLSQEIGLEDGMKQWLPLN
jgi:cytochrome oxidase Cu insertion factor (SCO1/SenC/PrrC family)